MVKITPYHSELSEIWDNYVHQCINGTFLFYRQFMEYHSDRFTDSSLLFFKNDKLIAILPANLSGRHIISHQGLTYGGLIYGKKTSTQDIIDALKALKEYALSHNITHVTLKLVPNIFRSVFSEDDAYSLFVSDAKLTRRDLSYAINLKESVPFTPDKRNKLRKFKRSKISISKEVDFSGFMKIVNNNLSSKFGVATAHTAEEMTLLHERFPNNIKLYIARDFDEIVGGAVCFCDNKFIHTQYLHANSSGKKSGALEGIIDVIINENRDVADYLSFGTCTTDNGYTLNQGLASFKRGFGSFSLVHDFYELSINQQ